MAKKLAFDKVLFTTVVVLLCLGLAMVYSASAAYAREEGGLSSFVVKQSIAAVLGMLAMAVIMHLDYRTLRRPLIVYGGVVLVLLLLVAVLFSPEINGTSRWFVIGGFSFQPSELAKLALVLFIAYQLDRKLETGSQRSFALPCVILTGLMSALILLETDLGTTVLLGAIAVLMLFVAGLDWRWLLGGMALTLPVMVFQVLMVPYRKARLLAFLDPSLDPQATGYQASQSLIAVGSGGLFGLGPGNSVQKLYFLPYPHSDFIYSIVSEELGLIGALSVLGLFVVLLWRGVRAGAQAPDILGRYLAWGFTAMLTIQAFIHMSVVLSLLPTKGIPLPLISYGGSSLLTTMAACGVILNVSQHG